MKSGLLRLDHAGSGEKSSRSLCGDAVEDLNKLNGKIFPYSSNGRVSKALGSNPSAGTIGIVWLCVAGLCGIYSFSGGVVLRTNRKP